MLKLIKNKKCKGFSLLEILLVLAIAAALVIGAFIIYPKIQASARVDTEAKNLATITAGIKSLFGSQATYIGLSLDSANNAQIFPDNMVLSSTRARYNAWRGEGSLSAEQDGPSNVMGNSFSITYKGVPAEECSKLVSSVAGYFYIIKVATTVVKPADGTLDIDSLTTQCKTRGNNNTLVFISL